jgi:hypothetical protein
MWDSLRGLVGGTSPEPTAPLGVLVLRPDPSARLAVHGFKSGAELRVGADAPGQTVSQILGKLNKYRGPDQQIRRVWSEGGEEIVGSTVPTGNLVAVVKASSV